MKAKNNSQRINDEVEELEEKNNPLFMLAMDVDLFCQLRFGIEITITHIFRTRAEQKVFYGQDSTKRSPHEFWHAIDIRSRVFKPEQIKEIVDYLNDKYNGINKKRWTAKCHEVGNHGMHFHIQLYVTD